MPDNIFLENAIADRPWKTSFVWTLNLEFYRVPQSKFMIETDYYFIYTEFRTYVWCIVNLEPLILISKVVTLKFGDQCLIPSCKLSLQAKTTVRYERGIKLIRNSGSDGD